MARERYQPHSGISYLSGLCQRLPQALADKIFDVERDIGAFVITWMDLTELRIDDSSWSTDALLARVALEAPNCIGRREQMMQNFGPPRPRY